MSKIGCACGRVISDNSDSLPYKGYLIPDTVYLDLFDMARQAVAGYLQARENGTEREWLTSHFGERYPDLALAPEAVIHDLFTRYLFAADRIVYQCPDCQRLLVQKYDPPNHYHVFGAESAEPNVFAPRGGD